MSAPLSDIPEFGREFLDAGATFTRIGSGELGGKAAGLHRIRREILSRLDRGEFPSIEVVVPTLTVLTTDSGRRGGKARCRCRVPDATRHPAPN